MASKPKNSSISWVVLLSVMLLLLLLLTSQVAARQLIEPASKPYTICKCRQVRELLDITAPPEDYNYIAPIGN
ncbi:hypothetical protein ACOSP7_031589 [Xanthoceras sorbifolium]